MPFALDVVLIFLSLLLFHKRKTDEMAKIAVCITGFIVFTSIANVAGGFDYLESTGLSWFWYVVYCAWIAWLSLVCKNSDAVFILFIGYVYCVACAVAAKSGNYFFYDSYPFVIFSLNVVVLGVSHGNYSGGHHCNGTDNYLLKIQTH